MSLNRRRFIQAISGTAAGGMYVQAAPGEWGGPVVDCHFHPRRTPEANTAHLDGAGISNAMLLARLPYAERFSELQAKYPGRYLGWFGGTDVTRPDAAKALEQAIKDGAIGFGELKSHVEAAGPELRRLYALAGELGVPILVHFQEVPHTSTEGTFATGFKNFEAMLKGVPENRFHRARRRVLGEHQRRLCEPGSISIRQNRPRRHHRQTARRILEFVRRSCGELRQQRALAGPAIHRRLFETAPGQVDLRQ